jgi:hypothetical protein
MDEPNKPRILKKRTGFFVVEWLGKKNLRK